MATVPDIIERLGGCAKIAAATGFPLTTVHSWSRANHVPSWRRAALIKMAKDLRKPLAEKDFPERASSQVAA